MKEYIKKIESDPNFEGWIIFDFDGKLLSEFDTYDDMLEGYIDLDDDCENCFAGHAIADPRNIMNTGFKAAEVFY